MPARGCLRLRQIPGKADVTIYFVESGKRIMDLDLARRYQLAPFTIDQLARDPRDKIFGLQGLSGNLVAIDYLKTVKQVYCEYAKSWVEDTRTLVILYYSPDSSELLDHYDLPSFVPNWNTISNSKRGFRETLSEYHACRNLSSLPNPWIEQEQDFTLQAPGVCCDVCEIFPEIDSSWSNFVDLCKEIGSKTWNWNMAPLRLLLLTLLGNHNSRIKQFICGDNQIGPRDSSVSLYSSLLAFFWSQYCSDSKDRSEDFLEDIGLWKDLRYTTLFHEVFPGLRPGQGAVWNGAIQGVLGDRWESLMY